MSRLHDLERRIGDLTERVDDAEDDLAQVKVGARWLTDAVDQPRIRLQRLETRR